MRCLSGSCPLAVLPHASLVITHAGHGTVMAAIAAGVPLVCVPMGRDQPAVAAHVTHHGLGVRVQPENGVEELRAAICHVLDQPSYHRAAQRMANAVEPTDRIINEIEALAATATAVRHESGGAASSSMP